MTAYGSEFFTMNEVNRLQILQDVVDNRLGSFAEFTSGVRLGDFAVVAHAAAARPLLLKNKVS